MNNKDAISQDDTEKKTEKKSKSHVTLPLFTHIIVYLSFVLLTLLAVGGYQFYSIIDNHIQSKTEKMFFRIEKNINSVANNKFQKILNNVSKNLSKATSKTIDLANSKLLKNERDADKALNMSLKYIQANKFEQARIYIINAINHDPSNIKYINQLMYFIRDNYASNYDILRELRSIIELSLFQVAPDNIELIENYISEIDKYENQIINKENKSSIKSIDWTYEFIKLKKNNINKICLKPTQINNKYIELNKILTNIQGDKKYNDLVTQVIKEMEYTKKIYDLSTIANNIEKYLILLNTEQNYSSESSTARILAASKKMSFFWEYDISQLPTKLRRKILEEFPEKIKYFGSKIKKAKSIKFFKQAIEILSNAQNYSKNDNVTYQERIQKLLQAKEKVSMHLLPEIIFDGYRGKILKKFKHLNNRVVTLQRGQYIAYQKWAVQICSYVFNENEKVTVYTDEDAKRIFNSSNLKKIDLRLISPEVSQVYQKVLQTIIAELPASDAFDIQKIVMTAKKKKVEDF